MRCSSPRTSSRVVLAVAVLVALGSAFGLRAADQLSRWTISGTRILAPSGEPLRLRGFNVCWWVPPTDQDAADIKALGANCVRYMFGYEPKGTYDPRQVDEVVQQVRCFTSRGLWVIPVLYMFQVPDPADPKKHLDQWSNAALNQEYLALWSDVVARLKDDPYVAAWEPINEPHDIDPKIVAAWYRNILPQFRKLDPLRPIVVEGANYSHAEDLTDLFKMDDPNIIYAFHNYYPYEFTGADKTPLLAYPGRWGKAYLEQKLAPALAFRDKFHVPVWCGEFGCKTDAPGYDLWIRDMHDLIEADQLDWCIWAWALQPRHPANGDFDINKHKPGVYGLMQTLFRQAAPPAAR